MRIGRFAALAALIVGSLAFGKSAGAQLGFTVTGRYEAVTKGSGRYGSVALYPLAPFMRGGIFDEGGVGTKTTHGVLFAADFGFTPSNGKSFEVGGWFWKSSNNDVYQIHARSFFSRELAVQLGWLNGSNRRSAYTLFLIHDLASANVAPESRRKWAVQGGLGVIYYETRDPLSPTGAKGPMKSDFTMYVQGSLEIAKNLSVNATHWYLRENIADLNRFALGIGYSF